MSHGVVPQQVAALLYRPGNIRAPAYEAANQEEGSTHLMVVQQIEQLLSVGVIGSIIKGERDLLNIGAGDNGVTEELRGRPSRGIGIAPGRKPGNQTRGDQLGKHASRV
jgi:hypothetical protein